MKSPLPQLADSAPSLQTRGLLSFFAAGARGGSRLDAVLCKAALWLLSPQSMLVDRVIPPV